MKTVKNANLPENVGTVIMGQKYSNLLSNSLDKLGISVIFVPNNTYVDSRLSGHADLSVLHIGENKLILAPYLKNTEFSQGLENLGFDLNFPDILQATKYPYDAQLNICIFGSNVIYNPDVCSRTIAKLLTISNRIIVQQGYSKCSVCVVDEHSIITSDRGIWQTAIAAGLGVLLIHPGSIRLDGFEYGFIGGASFKISKHQLAFTGTLDLHPSKDVILSFLKEREIEPIFLTNYPIFDIGSAIPILENP